MFSKKVGKDEVRQMANEIDKIMNEIDKLAQAKIDRVTDRIDSELQSCGRELNGATMTLTQIKPLVDQLVMQVGENAPDHIKLIVKSACQEIMSKVTSVTSNIGEVQKNIKDVDKYTDEIDELTDMLDGFTDQVDKITDKYQN